MAKPFIEGSGWAFRLRAQGQDIYRGGYPSEAAARKAQAAILADGYGAATIDHERAELRRLFSYARKTWQWSRQSVNPASPVKAPPVDNARTRVLTNAEWERYPDGNPDV